MKLYFEQPNYPWQPERYRYAAEQMMLTLFPGERPEYPEEPPRTMEDTESAARFSLSREGDEAVITIRDYGPGIPEEELPHVKYKFYKGSSKARGSGIGLAVCDEIVTRHEGRLDIGNAEGGGCVVTIHLPIGG